jgi:hypothetical protein
MKKIARVTGSLTPNNLALFPAFSRVLRLAGFYSLISEGV